MKETNQNGVVRHIICVRRSICEQYLNISAPMAYQSLDNLAPSKKCDFRVSFDVHLFAYRGQNNIEFCENIRY